MPKSDRELRLQAAEIRSEILKRGGFLIVMPGNIVRLYRNESMPNWIKVWLRAYAKEMIELLTLGCEVEDDLPQYLFYHKVNQCPCSHLYQFFHGWKKET